MNSSFLQTKLGEVLHLNIDAIPVDPAATYQIAGVYSFARGLLTRAPLQGAATTYKVMHRLHKDDFVLSQLKAWEGALARVPESLEGWFLSPQFATFRVVPGKLEIGFLDWYCRQSHVWDSLRDKARGMGARRDSVSPGRFLELVIPLPPLPEQRRIVARIEELSAKIEEARTLRQQAVEEADAFGPAVSNALFERERTNGWASLPLGEVSDIRSGVTLGRTLNGPTVRLPYLRVANVQDGHLDLRIIKEVDVLESEADKWQLQSGDVLLTEGGDWDKLGRGTVWRGEIPNCIHQNHIFRVRANPDEFDADFLAAVISSPYGKGYFQAASKQTTNLASINQTQLKAFMIFRPPLLEQRQIVAYLDDLQAKVDAVKKLQEETTEELNALMPSILSRAFSGEL